MRFGTFHLIGSPEMAPPEKRVEETLAQIALADELGFEYAWVAEHHFSNYGYSVNPLLLIAKASALAPRLRFGQAVVVTPFWHPIRLAEDAALTDILTGGRFDLGVGRGYQPLEFEGFGLDIEDNREQFLEQMALMQKAWREDDFTHEGRFYQVPRPITILPKPLQKPHPPIWVATQSTASLDWAAEHGYHSLVSASTTSHDDLVAWRQRFDQKRTEVGHGPGRMGVLRFVYVTETEAEARNAVWQTRWQRRVADHLRRNDQRIEAGRNEAYPLPEEHSDEVWWDRLIYGTPERCVAQIKRDAELGFTDLMGWFDVGGLPAEQVARSMRLFAREVMPALAGASVG